VAWMNRIITRRLAIAAAATLAFVPACTRTAPPQAGATVEIHEHDFRIEASARSVAAGPVVFQVHNDAPATHEFVVVRTDEPDGRLPIGSDGLSVNEEELISVGELSEVESGAVDTLSIALTPGRYVFFCNMEGHYMGGMHGVVEVTGA
jgi:uncharacterized cupredoxin-like copper-binding protein